MPQSPRKKRKDGKIFNRGSAKHLKKLMRDEEIFDLKLTGMSYGAIADKVGLTKPRIHQIVTTYVDELNTSLLEKVEQARRIEIERCQKMLTYLQPEVEKGYTKAVQTALKISERLSRLRGLDAPVKIEGTGENGAITLEVFRKMLDEEDSEDQVKKAGAE